MNKVGQYPKEGVPNSKECILYTIYIYISDIHIRLPLRLS